ncbi:IS110 family transposase [Pseudomonas syringae pv. actinidifoliorum]|uniref:IS110 family transposase n=1 Tax=Pseudomonas syringae TaxID=317 RepID=UPI000985C729|nr:IS110 family transposase [Pseudomonas syringae]OOK92697.1 IS110 family transposase [Pseudomonas syringae pv. actinidifoliorum]
MAMRVSQEKMIIGVDVAKNELVIYHEQYDQLEAIPNTKVAIAKWLKTLAGTSAIAIEATNVYHVLFADMAYEAGCEVYVLDGYQLSSYRKSVNIRAKTDAQDARLLARYLKNEFDELRPWIPPSPLYRQLLSLFRRRAALVQARTGLVQSWANETLLKTAFANQINSMKRLEALVEKKIRDVLQEAGLMVQVNRCMKVEGIGFLTAARLVTSYQRGEFSGADAFIAFLGLDLRVSKSGQRDGPRRLTKRGDPEARRLLHNAAMSGSRTPAWKPFYEEQRKRGFSTTQALVMLARKMARVVFALLKNQSEYQTKAA